METPTQNNLQAEIRILKYIRGAFSHGNFYSFSNDITVVGYLDSDRVGYVDEKKSTCGKKFYFGKSAFIWSLNKQDMIVLSTTEVEYIAPTSCASQTIWLQRLFEEMKHD